MLNATLLSNILKELPEFSSDEQFLEGDGYDAILQELLNLRSATFPLAILEGRSSGTIQLISDGPLDTFTQSVWIMCQEGRGESTHSIYEQARQLAVKVLAKLLEKHNSGTAELAEWDYQRTAYLKREGGQNTRGWELVLTFREDFSLIIEPEPVVENGGE